MDLKMNLIEKKLSKLTKIQIQKIYQILKIKYDKNNSKKKLIINVLKPLKMKYRMKRDRESPEYDSGKRRKLEQVCVNKQREKYYTDVSEEECEFLIRENGDKFGKIPKLKIEFGNSNYRWNRPLKRPFELPPRTLPSTENFDDDVSFDTTEINGKKYMIKEYNSDEDCDHTMRFYEANKDIMTEHIQKDDRTIYIQLCHPFRPKHFSYYTENGGIWDLLNRRYEYQNKRFGGIGKDGEHYNNNKDLFYADVEFVLENYYLTDIERKILEQISVKKTKKIQNFPQLYLEGIIPKISKDFDHEDLKLSNFVYCGDLNGEFKVLLIDPLLTSDYA